MRKLDLKSIHSAELLILTKFDELCKSLEVKYYIYYGTLLGAVRHGGFIPWDDDVDVIMPRPDFDRFVRYCEEYSEELMPFQLMYYTNNDKYIYPIGRLCDTRYKVDYFGNDDYGLGLFIDIYPYDGVGNSYIEAVNNIKKLRLIRHFLQLAGTNHLYKSRYGFWATTLKRIARPVAKALGVKRFIQMEQKIISKYTFEDSRYITNALWNGYGIRELAEKDSFNDPILIDFVGHSFYAPKNYDEHLRRLYGNYMELPPKESRHPTHEYKAYLKDKR